MRVPNSNQHGTPAAAAHQPTNPAEAEPPATAAASTLPRQASTRPPPPAHTATNPPPEALTREVVSPRRLPRTRPRPRAVTTVLGTTRAERAVMVFGIFLLVSHAQGRFFLWKRGLAKFLGLNLLSLEKIGWCLKKNKERKPGLLGADRWTCLPS